ncbi:MAG: hypothetical protein K8R77_02685 [Anaerolineaceae bacterium]|nr:hypothetical protein [Anaerolineaceae bacterium]
MSKCVAAIDQGTTSTKRMTFNRNGLIYIYLLLYRHRLQCHETRRI